MKRRAGRSRVTATGLSSVLPLQGQGPLQQQLYATLRAAMLAGDYPAGSKLPSTRSLAEQAGVARNTVLAVFDRLRTEGYLVGRKGAGTFVASNLPDRSIQRSRSNRSARGAVRPLALDQAPRAAGARPGPRVDLQLPPPEPFRPFAMGVTAVDQFPHEQWGRLLARAWQRLRGDLGRQPGPGGLPALRTMIARYLGLSRGMTCSPEQVVIVDGTQQAIALCAQMLLSPRDPVLLEDPGYDGARGAFQAMGASLFPVATDHEGMQVAGLAAACPAARLAFVTPSRGFPLGHVMSLSRRKALLAWAHQQGAWILEDDYDHEFRYAGRPLPALQALDSQGCVIHTGSFNKILFPGLRLGFMVVPASLVDLFRAAKHHADVHTSLLEQQVLADFMEGGHFEGHVRRVRRAAAERQQHLLALAQERLSPWLTLEPADTGVHLVGWLSEGITEASVVERCRVQGVSIRPLSRYALRPLSRAGLLLGYAAFSLPEITRGVERLRDALVALDEGGSER